jgi:hypothetical protein
MINTEKQSNNGRVSIGDIIIVLVLAMLWFLLVQVSDSFVIVAMSGLAWFIVAMFFISKYTGVLSYLKLLKPTWTISYLISVPIWYLVFAILPQVKGSSLASTISQEGINLLSKILPMNIIEWFLNSWMFGSTESLLAILLIAIFIGVASSKSRFKTNNKGTIAAIFIVVGFMALLHTGIALLQDKGLGVTITLIHQLVSFFIMVIIGIFLHAPGLIASHVAKNDIVFGFTYVSIIFCVILDIISLISSKRNPENKIIKKIGGFS